MSAHEASSRVCVPGHCVGVPFLPWFILRSLFNEHMFLLKCGKEFLFLNVSGFASAETHRKKYNTNTLMSKRKYENDLISLYDSVCFIFPKISISHLSKPKSKARKAEKKILLFWKYQREE